MTMRIEKRTRPALCALTFAVIAANTAWAQAEALDKHAPAVPAAPTTPSAQAASPIETGGYETIRVRRQNMPEYLPAVGALGAFQTTQIGSQVSGRLQDVLVDVGDVVAKGQPVAKIDTVFFAIEADQRRAELKSAQSRAAYTKLRWERVQNLFGTGQDAVVAEQAVDDARSDYDIAQSQLAQSSLAVRFAPSSASASSSNSSSASSSPSSPTGSPSGPSGPGSSLRRG